MHNGTYILQEGLTETALTTLQVVLTKYFFCSDNVTYIQDGTIVHGQVATKRKCIYHHAILVMRKYNLDIEALTPTYDL